MMKLAEAISESGEAERASRFLVDGMLGSLSRKLRILGFDTLYEASSKDGDLLALAKLSGRYLVTSDVELYFSARRFKIRSILVNSRSEREALFQILSKAGVRHIGSDFSVSRCSVCNGNLVDSARIVNGKKIYTCQVCGKDYWKGAHWKKLNILFRDVSVMLAKHAAQIGI